MARIESMLSQSQSAMPRRRRSSSRGFSARGPSLSKISSTSTDGSAGEWLSIEELELDWNLFSGIEFESNRPFEWARHCPQKALAATEDRYWAQLGHMFARLPSTWSDVLRTAPASSTRSPKRASAKPRHVLLQKLLNASMHSVHPPQQLPPGLMEVKASIGSAASSMSHDAGSSMQASLGTIIFGYFPTASFGLATAFSNLFTNSNPASAHSFTTNRQS